MPLCVCARIFYVGHPTMSNGPLLRAASCVELLPAVTLTHTQTNVRAQWGRFLGSPFALIPSTIHHCCICCVGPQSLKLLGEELASLSFLH